MTAPCAVPPDSLVSLCVNAELNQMHAVPGDVATQSSGGVLKIYIPAKPFVCIKEPESIFYVNVLV